MNGNHLEFMELALDMAKLSIKKGGGPFGCVIVNKEGKILSATHNHVQINNDPTAHAEVTAIREACKELNHFQLEGCIIYTSCEPCPMCLGAIYWARPSKVYYALTKREAAEIDFDDEFIYQEIAKKMDERFIPFESLRPDNTLEPFKVWKDFSSINPEKKY